MCLCALFVWCLITDRPTAIAYVLQDRRLSRFDEEHCAHGTCGHSFSHRRPSIKRRQDRLSLYHDWITLSMVHVIFDHYFERSRQYLSNRDKGIPQDFWLKPPSARFMVEDIQGLGVLRQSNAGPHECQPQVVGHHPGDSKRQAKAAWLQSSSPPPSARRSARPSNPNQPPERSP